jgi:adenine-specific DNA-methyltransferase
MEKRLKLAQKLLKKSGAIFISIDDNEQAPLKMLCDEIFGEENFIANVPRRTKSAGKTTETISLNHDYVLIYSKDRQMVKFSAIIIDDSAYKYKDEYFSERGPYALSQTLDYDSLSYSDSLDYELKLGDHIFYPGGDKKAFISRKAGKHRSSDWTWRWGKELVDFGNKNGFIVIKSGKDGHPRIYTKTYFKVTIEKTDGKYKITPIDRAKNLSTLDLMESIYSNDVAKKDIREIFGASAEFAYPKPVSLIKYLINSIYRKDRLTILDFFAGSGTTGQAVLDLNKEDGGDRKFILCTNNENNICTEVCYPRLKKVIKGYKNIKGENVAGLGGNLKYYTCDFVEAEPTDQNKRKLVSESTEMLCIRENAFELVQDESDFKIFKNSNKYLGIIFYEEAIDDFKKAIKKIEGHFNTYVFSLGDDPHEKQFADVKRKVTLCAIPEVILKVYREIFK